MGQVSVRISSVLVANRPPRLPGDPQDHERDPEADDRIDNWCSARDDDRRGNHSQAHERIGSGMVSIADPRGAAQSSPTTAPVRSILARERERTAPVKMPALARCTD
jgi:hypothetical protein